MAFPSIGIGKAGNTRVVIAHCTNEGADTLPGMELGPPDDKRAGLFVGEAHNTDDTGNISGLYVWDDTDLAGLSDDTDYEVGVVAAGGANWIVQAELVYGVAKKPALIRVNETETGPFGSIGVAGVNAAAGDHVGLYIGSGDAISANKFLESVSDPLVIREPAIATTTAPTRSVAHFASGAATSTLASAMLTATFVGTVNTRASAIAGVWAPPAAGDTNDGGGARKVRVVDTRKRERAEEEARRERDAREAERRRIIDRVFREVIDGLPPELADDPEFVTQAVEEELARQGLGPVKDIAVLIASARTAHRRAVEQRNNDALALLLLAS